MLNIDQLAYTNRLRNVHPLEKFIFSTATMVVCLAFNSTRVNLAVIIAMAAVLTVLAGIPWRFYLRLMTLPVGFLLIGILTVVISIGWNLPATGGWLYNWSAGSFVLGVRSEDLILGMNIFGKSLATVSCLYFLSLTTPMVEIISVLKRLKVPALFLELMSLIYRFIFVLMETAQKIYTSQSSRCGYATMKDSINCCGRLVSSLFGKAFQRSQMLFTSLSARGFTGDLNVLEPEFNFSKKNLCIIILFELSLVLTAYLFGGKQL